MKRTTVDLQRAPWKLFTVLGVKIHWPKDIEREEFLKQEKCIVEIEIPDYKESEKRKKQ